MITGKKLKEHIPSASKPVDIKAEQINKRFKDAMIVDDSPTMRKLIRKMIQKIGIKDISEASNGMQCLEKIKKRKFDLIIADWLMPKMNGAVLIKKIRKDPDYKNTPIIVVSAEYGEKIEKAIKAGANGYLNKPFKPKDLKKILAQVAFQL